MYTIILHSFLSSPQGGNLNEIFYDIMIRSKSHTNPKVGDKMNPATSDLAGHFPVLFHKRSCRLSGCLMV